MPLIIIIVTVAIIVLMIVLILIIVNRRRRATKGHISIKTKVQIQDFAKPLEGEFSNNNCSLQSLENEFPLVQQNAQYASEDIENPKDKARRRVYFRNVLEDAGRHELREDQEQRQKRLELERK